MKIRSRHAQKSGIMSCVCSGNLDQYTTLQQSPVPQSYHASVHVLRTHIFKTKYIRTGQSKPMIYVSKQPDTINPLAPYRVPRVLVCRPLAARLVRSKLPMATWTPLLLLCRSTTSTISPTGILEWQQIRPARICLHSTSCKESTGMRGHEGEIASSSRGVASQGTLHGCANIHRAKRRTKITIIRGNVDNCGAVFVGKGA